MTIDIRLVPGPVRAVPRVGVPFAPVPPAAPPRCPASRPLPPPPDIRLPVMTVGGARPDRTGNVDLTPFLAGFVSHVGDSSIHHTAAEIGQIAAGKVAEVVDGAPAALDTLREIADVIGTEAGSGAAGILKRVSDLESGKVDKVQGKGLSANDYTDEDKAKLAGLSPQAQADWGQTDTTAPDFIKNKPTIPAPVTIDPALSTTSENPVQNKAVTNALYAGFTEWEFSGSGYDPTKTYAIDESPSSQEGVDNYDLFINGEYAYTESGVPGLTSIGYESLGITATRHLVTPTKTSQLTNDGAPNGGGTPYATTAQIPDVTGKADKVSGATAGNLAALNAQGNLADSGVKPSDFATPSDLPYAMVTPGEWEFSGVSAEDNPSLVFENGAWRLYAGGLGFSSGNTSNSAMSVVVDTGGMFGIVTATRASLPGHLLDRAVNAVSVTETTELTLPALVNAGKARDFIVRLAISGSTVPTVTFAAPTGETIVYETDGDKFPVPDAEGTWLYSFTETAAHTFAVALKSVSVVTQGGV